MARKRNFGLDLVRAIAILLVIISHSSLLLLPDSEPLIKTVLKLGGALGVDMFFVLSGFLIGGLLLDLLEKERFGIYDVGYFWIRRWLRTLPNYFFALILNCILGFFLFKSLPPDLGSFFYFFQNFSDSQSNFFLESWTLSIEEFSYIFLPTSIFLIYRFRKNTRQAFLWGSLLLIVIASYFRIKYHLSHTNLDYHYWTMNLRKVVIHRLDAISFGFLAVYFMRYHGQTIKSKMGLFFALGSILVVSMHLVIYYFNLTPDKAQAFYNLFYLQLIGSAFGLMIWYTTRITTNATIVVKITTYISQRSYAVYLLNYSIVLLSLQYFEHKEWLIVSKPIQLLLFLVFTFGLSELLYRFYEKPMTNLREHPIFKRRKK